jgi:hypothetical protein
MNDPLSGICLVLGALSLLVCSIHYTRVGLRWLRRRRRSTWYQLDSARNPRLDYRDFQRHFNESDVPSILRRQAE